MANKFTDAAHNLTGLKPTTKAVLLVLAYHADNTTGECWPSIMTIASKAGLSKSSRNSVRDALKELADFGIVSVVGSKPTKNGSVSIFKVSSDILKPGYQITRCSENPVLSASDTRCSELQHPVLRAPQNSSQNSSEKNSSIGNRAVPVAHKSKTENEDTDQNFGETPNPQDQIHWHEKWGLRDSTPMTFVALTEHIHQVMPNQPDIRPTDPLLPFLVWLAEEQLKVDVTRSMSIPPADWDEERDGYDCFVEVSAADPRHPGTDKTWMKGGSTLRELAVLNVWTKFGFAVSILEGLAQYLDLVPKEKLPEGWVQYRDEDLIEVMRGLGWPEGGMAGGVLQGMDEDDEDSLGFGLNDIWAIAHWAFKVSDYWPEKIKSVKDFVKRFPTLVKQYNAYYEKLPEGKKPHDIGMGRPKAEGASA